MDEPFVAAEGGGETEEGRVAAGMAFMTGAESAVAGQPRHRALDHPPAAPQPFAGLDAFARDADSDSVSSGVSGVPPPCGRTFDGGISGFAISHSPSGTIQLHSSVIRLAGLSIEAMWIMALELAARVS